MTSKTSYNLGSFCSQTPRGLDFTLAETWVRFSVDRGIRGQEGRIDNLLKWTVDSRFLFEARAGEISCVVKSPQSTISGLQQSRVKAQVLSFVLVIVFLLKSEPPSQSLGSCSSSVCGDNDTIYLRFLPDGNELVSAKGARSAVLTILKPMVTIVLFVVKCKL